MIVKPFQQQSRYTTMDNFIIDHVMPKISGSAWKVLTVIIRNTIGWHKECDELSFTQIKTLTGIKTNTTVSEALKELEKIDVVKVDRPDRAGNDPTRFWKSNIYSLNLDFEVETGDEESSHRVVQKIDYPPPENRLPLVQKIDTQKKESLNKESKRKRAKSGPPPPIAIEAYRETANLYPRKQTWEMIVQAVGESPEAIDFWKKIIVTWIGCDFNPRNVTGMLDCFKRGELPTTKKGATNGSHAQRKYDGPTPGNRAQPATGAPTVADKLTAALRAKSRTGGDSPGPEMPTLRRVPEARGPTE